MKRTLGTSRSTRGTRSALQMHRVRVAGIVVALLAATLQAGQAADDPSTEERGFVDLHVHAAGIGSGDSGIILGPEMRESFRLPIYLRAFGVTREAIEAEGDGLVIARIAGHVAASRRVDKAVVLALDGVVDADGVLDLEATQVYVPNAFVAREVARHDHLCFGASVNPYRRDALERLAQVREAGALLVKWIPNIMGIDPGDPTIRPFYERLIELDLPLLTHAGQERAFASAVDAFGDPLRLELPLSMGVTVVAAHIATTGKNAGEGNFERVLPLFDRYPTLYADISSLTQINKLGYLKRALAVPGLEQRLVYGTDWPLQFFPLVSPYYQLRHIGFRAARSIAAIDNPWDRDVALKEALGTPRHIFARSEALLDMARCAPPSELP